MAPIKVALIGLSAGAITSWAERGHLPYLQSARGKAKYEIVALLNSSEKSAQAAKAHFKLDEHVRTYGDPAVLAADAEVELVVCATRVDNHYKTIEPSVRAGKAVFVEWPLVDSYERALELVKGQPSAVQHSVIGLQGRVTAPVRKVKELLTAGRIGRVLSSDVRASGSLLPRDALYPGLEYMTDRKVGGNQVTIGFTHTIDLVHSVVGEFESFQSWAQIQRPQVKLLGPNPSTLTSDVPDLIAVHGRLQKGGPVEIADDATLAVTFRLGPPFKTLPSLQWTIAG